MPQPCVEYLGISVPGIPRSKPYKSPIYLIRGVSTRKGCFGICGVLFGISRGYFSICKGFLLVTLPPDKLGLIEKLQELKFVVVFCRFMMQNTARRLRDSKWKKTSQGFWRVPWEQAHWELWKEPPLDMFLSWHLRSLLWPTSGLGLDVIWKSKCHLWHFKWGLILKLSSK